MSKTNCLRTLYNKLTGQTATGKSICDILDEINGGIEGVLAGKASLVNGKVPATQLPSYVDDVIEGYYYNSKFYSDSEHETEITGETGKIYVDLTSNNTYRWGGSAYTEVSAGTQLPTTVNGKYLHTNSITGALEWADAGGGGGSDYDAVIKFEDEDGEGSSYSNPTIVSGTLPTLFNKLKAGQPVKIAIITTYTTGGGGAWNACFTLPSILLNESEEDYYQLDGQSAYLQSSGSPRGYIYNFTWEREGETIKSPTLVRAIPAQ